MRSGLRTIKGLQGVNVYIREKSTKVSNVNNYINTWLGSDLKGERHTRNIVNGQYPGALQPVSSSVGSLNMRAPLVISPNRLTAPVVSVDWLAPSEDIERAMASTDLKNNACFLDLSNAPSSVSAAEVNQMVELAARAGITAVAAVNAENCAASSDMTLPVLRGFSQPIAAPPSVAAPTSREEPVAATPSQQAVPSIVYSGTVRSGQQIYAEGTSLVVIGSVNNGAELLADGDIHVYGKLAGRAIAGLSGDESARVFARDFQPSLVGIANGFAPIDDLEANPAFGKFVSVRLQSVEVELKSREYAIECDEDLRMVLAEMD